MLTTFFGPTTKKPQSWADGPGRFMLSMVIQLNLPDWMRHLPWHTIGVGGLVVLVGLLIAAWWIVAYHSESDTI